MFNLKKALAVFGRETHDDHQLPPFSRSPEGRQLKSWMPSDLSRRWIETWIFISSRATRCREHLRDEGWAFLNPR